MDYACQNFNQFPYVRQDIAHLHEDSTGQASLSHEYLSSLGVPGIFFFHFSSGL